MLVVQSKAHENIWSFATWDNTAEQAEFDVSSDGSSNVRVWKYVVHYLLVWFSVTVIWIVYTLTAKATFQSRRRKREIERAKLCFENILWILLKHLAVRSVRMPERVWAHSWKNIFAKKTKMRDVFFVTIYFIFVLNVAYHYSASVIGPLKQYSQIVHLYCW